jgi:hypothetical protein
LDEEKSKHASLAQQNDFGPTCLLFTKKLVQGTGKKLCTCQREECNKNMISDYYYCLLPVSNW